MKNGVLFAASAGFVGALIWAGISYFLHLESGWIAWGIGGVVGLGMMAGAKEMADVKTGGVAVAIALVSIVLGKFMAIEFAYSDTGWSEFEQRILTEEELIISYVADDVVYEYSEEGKALNYPTGANMESPETQGDYPSDVWQEAETRWQAMSDQDKQDYRQATIDWQEESYADAMSGFKNEDFLASFSFFDLLWFALGGFTAFKLGSGVS